MPPPTTSLPAICLLTRNACFVGIFLGQSVSQSNQSTPLYSTLLYVKHLTFAGRCTDVWRRMNGQAGRQTHQCPQLRVVGLTQLFGGLRNCKIFNAANMAAAPFRSILKYCGTKNTSPMQHSSSSMKTVWNFLSQRSKWPYFYDLFLTMVMLVILLDSTS